MATHPAFAIRNLAFAIVTVLAMLMAGLAPSTSVSAAPASPLDGPGWELAAHMSDSGGMFDGLGDLTSTYTYGTFVPAPTASTSDFQRPFPIPAGQILFITGDRTIWGATDYASLRALIDARTGDFAPNLAFLVGDGGTVSGKTGNVLSRLGPIEDPWISIDGGHFDAISNGRIAWGEANWGNPWNGHVTLKNTHGGLDVYVREASSAPVINAVNVPAAPVSLDAQPVAASVDFSDADVGDLHTCAVNYGDGTGDQAGAVAGGTCTAPSHTYAEPGVYTISATVTDWWGASGSADATSYVVIYDPSAGFVTGGGWIDSPAGALAADADAAGKASFGFVSRYKKGANVPTGNTQFQFKAGDLNFHSSAYDWLVIAGSNAKFKGVGTINGDGAYGFMITGCDEKVSGSCGGQDTFRIKIWDTADDSGVYDNGSGSPLGGGNIKVHKG